MMRAVRWAFYFLIAFAAGYLFPFVLGVAGVWWCTGATILAVALMAVVAGAYWVLGLLDLTRSGSS